MKVPTHVPSTSWLPVSRMKLRSSRGPNWVEAWVRVTMVMENPTPATVITEPARVDSRRRAPSGPTPCTQRETPPSGRDASSAPMPKASPGPARHGWAPNQ